MSYDAEHSELRARFAAQIGNTPVSWPNVTFTPPSPPALWARFNILDSPAEQTTIGASTNNHRVIGVVVVQIFAPLNAGTRAALQKADAVAAIFRNWGGTTVQCRAASVKDIGPDGYGWYQVNVQVPFKRDELL